MWIKNYYTVIITTEKRDKEEKSEEKNINFIRQPYKKNSKQVSWKLKLNQSLAEILRFFSVAMSVYM